jgi:hypothetical protein
MTYTLEQIKTLNLHGPAVVQELVAEIEEKTQEDWVCRNFLEALSKDEDIPMRIRAEIDQFLHDSSEENETGKRQEAKNKSA